MKTKKKRSFFCCFLPQNEHKMLLFFSLFFLVCEFTVFYKTNESMLKGKKLIEQSKISTECEFNVPSELDYAKQKDHLHETFYFLPLHIVVALVTNNLISTIMILINH